MFLYCSCSWSNGPQETKFRENVRKIIRQKKFGISEGYWHKRGINKLKDGLFKYLINPYFSSKSYKPKVKVKWIFQNIACLEKIIVPQF